jgi:hypothetical protein
MKTRWDWGPALYVLLGLVVGAILATLVFVIRDDKGGATGTDPSRVETCILKTEGVATSVWPLGKTFEFGVSFRAPRGAFRYSFATVNYVVAFMNSESAATALAGDVRGFAKVWDIDPDFVRTKGAVAYWPEDENSDDFLDTIAACLS